MCQKKHACNANQSQKELGTNAHVHKLFLTNAEVAINNLKIHRRLHPLPGFLSFFDDSLLMDILHITDQHKPLNNVSAL